VCRWCVAQDLASGCLMADVPDLPRAAASGYLLLVCHLSDRAKCMQISTSGIEGSDGRRLA
jgi:hypothetical protein